MKLVYTHSIRTMVSNVKNILEQAGIETILRNEYAQGGIGEVSPFDSWMEVWVRHDQDLARAKEITAEHVQRLAQEDGIEWACNQCTEMNASSFEYCWNCRTDREAV